MQTKHPLIKKNDKVIVLSGKEKGKIGSVLKVDSEKKRVIVEKINIVKKHSKPSGKGAQGQGGIIEKEAPIHISNVMVICNKCAKPGPGESSSALPYPSLQAMFSELLERFRPRPSRNASLG